MEEKTKDRILVLAIRAIGDVVLVTPLFRHLKTQHPTAYLAVLADGTSAQVLEHNPHIDQILVIDRAASRTWPLAKRLKAWGRIVSDIRDGQFDVVIDLFSGPRSAMLAWLSRAADRYGEDYRSALRGFFYNHRISVVRDGRHLVEQKLDIIAPLVGRVACQDSSLEISLTEEEQAKAQTVLWKGHAHPPRVVGLIPASGSLYRNWPPERFAELGDRLVETFKADVLLLGGADAVTICRHVSSMMRQPHRDFSGQTTLRELLAMLAEMDMVVSNVTGPMHLAVALHRPQVIALYGAADIVQYAPWGPTGTLLTKGTPVDAYWHHVDYRRDHDWLRQITVDDVWRHVQALLAEPLSARHS
ncbi:MAG: hypothetical protein GKS05_06205 [Nitrospirales bacterium]|nr:hypothetical protein [Nitrospirales bacterium]